MLILCRSLQVQKKGTLGNALKTPFLSAFISVFWSRSSSNARGLLWSKISQSNIRFETILTLLLCFETARYFTIAPYLTDICLRDSHSNCPEVVSCVSSHTTRIRPSDWRKFAKTDSTAVDNLKRYERDHPSAPQGAAVWVRSLCMFVQYLEDHD